MGDYIAKIGKGKKEDTVGHFGLGTYEMTEKKGLFNSVRKTTCALLIPSSNNQLEGYIHGKAQVTSIEIKLITSLSKRDIEIV